MKKFETIVVTKEEAKEARKMISWFSQNVWEKNHGASVEFHALLDENGLKNVLSSLTK